MQFFARPLLALCLCAVPALAAAQQSAAPPRTTRPPVAAPAEIVNLNTASATQIASLPGIGLKTADLIVQYRLKNGPFRKIEEVMNVKGIGEKSFLRIKERITVADSRKPEAGSR